MILLYTIDIHDQASIIIEFISMNSSYNLRLRSKLLFGNGNIEHSLAVL